MQNYLIQHALDNVWCSPEQDNPYIFEAPRVSRSFGEINNFRLMGRTFTLPVQGERYHVYNIGHISPGTLGLIQRKPLWTRETWRKITDVISERKVLVQIYTSGGVELPRHDSYYMYTNEKNFFFIVREDPKLGIDFNTEALYFRVYSNAYYQSDAGDSTDDIMFAAGKKIKVTQDVIDLQVLANNYLNRQGKVNCFVNGQYVHALNLTTVGIGDTAEFIYDSSVKRVVTFTMRDLQTFNSVLDNSAKLLLHYPLPQGEAQVIDYQDDIDIRIYHPEGSGRYKGRYYHRNAVNSHRMVTHRDYSVMAMYIQYISSSLHTYLNDPSIDPNEFKLEVIIKNSGLNRPLIFDNSRIFELYKLPDDQVLQAMVGVHSTLDIWKAENLENNAYTAMMRASHNQVTIEAVQEGYGYNSMSKVVGDTPQKTVLNSNHQIAELPEILAANSTVYEYDASGTLLGFYYNSTERIYEAVNANTRLVEVISGEGTSRPDVRFGVDNIPLPVYDNYRVYMCFQNNGIPDNNWMDITGTAQYHVDNNTLIWNNLETDQFLMVRTDAKFLAYDLDIQSVNGNFFISLAEEENRGNGYFLQILPVPMGELDVFLNNKSLINGLDYIVKFPQLYILNRSHLLQPAYSTTQKLHIRFTGFCNSDLSFDHPDDYGFIEHGYLSNNNRHDIRDDKVLRITVDGATKHRDDLLFSELHDGISVVNPINGRPYQIKDVIVPLKELVNENTYSLKAKSLIIDKLVSDYLTVKLPQPDRDAPSAIPGLYQLTSPFVARIINALQDNEITYEQIAQAGSDNAVIELCQPFEGVLAFDPMNEDLGIDQNYILIVPHPLDTVIDMELYQYRFLTRVVKLYCHGLVNITPFVSFST